MTYSEEKMGSLKELETHILIAEKLEYVNEQQVSKLIEDCTELGKMISGLRRSLTKE
jgi:four helix bundle protein